MGMDNKNHWRYNQLAIPMFALTIHYMFRFDTFASLLEHAVGKDGITTSSKLCRERS